MNNQATLDRLRELKLTGMYQAFTALLQLPLHQQPPADELLAQLTEAEHDYRQQRKTQMAIRAARFRYMASLEELHYSPSRNLDKTAILRLADCGFIDRSENIFLTGATGCGKSYIASALGYQACQLGYRVGYHNLIKLLQRLQLAKADGSYQKEMGRLERLHLLILDDWGLQPLDQHAQLALLQIMEDRHGKAATIITSQLPVSKWHEYIGDPTLADAILDRISHKAHRLELKGESMRRKQRVVIDN